MAGPFISKENEQSVLEAIKAKLDALNSAIGGKANSSHTHNQSEITGLTDALAGKAPTSHNHTTEQITDLNTTLDNRYAKKEDVSGALNIVGSVENYAALPASPAKNQAYWVLTADPSHDIAAGELVFWNGTEWIDVGGTANVNLDNYYDKATSDQRFAPKSHTHEIANVNGLQSALDGKAPTSHTHNADQITDFANQVDARITANVRALTEEEVQEILAALG